MIEVITKSGVSLDLKAGVDIEYTIEHPLLESDNMPVGISTTITFPLSLQNRKAFGLWSGVLVGPQNTNIPVSILINGIAVLEGELVFISASDGEIEYSFKGTELPDFIRGELHELPDIDIISKWNTSLVGECNKTGRKDIAFPVMIRETFVADCELQIGTGTIYPSASNGYSITNAECSRVDKFVNFTASVNGSTAVVKVLWLIQKMFPDIIIDDDILETLSKMVIVAPNDVTVTEFLDIYENTYDEGDRNILRLSKALPKMSCADFLSNVLKMFAASIYPVGRFFYMKSAKNILEESSSEDWSDKICRCTAINTREAQAYEVKYANSPDSSEDNVSVEAEINEFATVEEMLNYFKESPSLVNAKVVGNPDVFSGKKVDVSILYETGFNNTDIYWTWIGPLVPHPIIDNCNHIGVKGTIIDAKIEETFSYDIGFNCVRCVPVHRRTPTEKALGMNDGVKSICPILSFPNIEGERSSDVFIGLLIHNQLLAYGNCYATDTQNVGVETSNDLSIGINGENGLYNKFHKQLSEWITQKKHIFKVELDLNINDICNLDISKKIMINNQLFIIKSLTVRINTTTGINQSEAELIEI